MAEKMTIQDFTSDFDFMNDPMLNGSGMYPFGDVSAMFEEHPLSSTALNAADSGEKGDNEKNGEFAGEVLGGLLGWGLGGTAGTISGAVTTLPSGNLVLIAGASFGAGVIGAIGGAGTLSSLGGSIGGHIGRQFDFMDLCNGSNDLEDCLPLGAGLY